MPDLTVRWKARNCSPQQPLSVALAVQEYVDHQLRLAAAETGGYAELDWQREDLRGMDKSARLEHKAQLCDRFPAMLSGRHYKNLSSQEWLPMYIVWVSIPRSKLSDTPYEAALVFCNVMWQSEAGPLGLSFYSNHQDIDHVLGYVACDGSEPIKQPDNVPKLLDFSRVTRFLLEYGRNSQKKTILKDSKDPRKPLTEVCIRAGMHVGSCKQARAGWEMGILDYTCMSFEVYKEQQESTTAAQQDGQTPGEICEVQKEQSFAKRGQHRSAYHMTARRGPSSNDEDSLVPEDDFAITILGLPAQLKPQEVFANIYGMFLVDRFWRIPGPSSTSPMVTFYVPSCDAAWSSKPQFYHRGRCVSCGPPVGRLGIHYTGRLNYTIDGTSLRAALSGNHFERYKQALSVAVKRAFKNPELAVELALDILDDDGTCDGTIGSALRSAAHRGADEYRVAFQEAWRRRDPALPTDATPYPCEDEQEDDLVRELGMTPVTVGKNVRSLLKEIGAYCNAEVHARSILLQAPASNKTSNVPRFEGFCRAVAFVIPVLAETNVSMRQYTRRYPKVVWVEETSSIVLREPEPCVEHGEQGDCTCWVPRYLNYAAKEYSKAHPKFDLSNLVLTCEACIGVLTGIFEVTDAEAGTDTTGHVCKRQIVVYEAERHEEPECTDLPLVKDVTRNELHDMDIFEQSSPSPLQAPNEPELPVDHSVQAEDDTVMRDDSHSGHSESPSSADTSSPIPLVLSDRDRSEHGIASTQANIEDLPMDDLLLHCAGLLKRRRDTDQAAISKQLSALNENNTCLQDAVAHLSRAEDELRSALIAREEEATESEHRMREKDELLHKKDAQIYQLQNSLKARDRRAGEMEDTINSLNQQLLETNSILAELRAFVVRSVSAAGVCRAADPEEDPSPEGAPARKRARMDRWTPVQRTME
ncbi:hypothetical protein CERSUDRAFT_97000 [Gelatoporia subvermispora B]|uniref:Uncharacterized protein n=1 Tax=Ceriporiopsis subvermispora (strain B) TaxID=914234 RepID=M2QDH2_CERS8|nr:hypothetical protein CERSUDRAFT_97000 [Gelatoporia subvermispora B]